MALTNAQYDEIMRGYDKRQLQNKYIHDKRIEEAYRKAPRLREIDSEIASASVRQAYRLMDGDDNALAALRLAIEDYKEERAALLSTLGYPLDYFEPIYTCPDCHDTGYIDGQKCHCFKQAIINTVYFFPIHRQSSGYFPKNSASVPSQGVSLPSHWKPQERPGPPHGGQQSHRAL